MLNGFLKVRLNEKGATILEYAVTAALIALVAAASINEAGRDASDSFRTAGTEMYRPERVLTVAGCGPAT
jgi:Flp pilus assembly pilin Flp